MINTLIINYVLFIKILLAYFLIRLFTRHYVFNNLVELKSISFWAEVLKMLFF